MRNIATAVKRPVYKVVKTGCKKRIPVLHSRMHEHWEVIPRGVAWRHGRDKKASDKSNRRRTLMTKTTEETETGLTEPRRAIVQNLNGGTGVADSKIAKEVMVMS